MNYQELSIKKLKEINKELFEKVYKNYKYDCVIFIAKGAYLIGEDFSKLGSTPLLEIYASRKGNKLKKILKPVLQLLPDKLKIFLRKKEMKSDIHDKNNDRQINYDSKKWENYLDCKKILIVDDSIDTGYSAFLVKEEVSKFFKKSKVKIAVLNYFKKAEKILKPDFYLYENTIIKGPWSNDSKENKKFLKLYNDWKAQGE